MKKVRMDMNGLLEEARIKGYFNLSDLQYGIMEANGEMSFLPYSKYQPLTRADINKRVHKNILNASIIIDGKIIKQNLNKMGKTIDWIEKEVKHSKYKKKDIMLCTLDEEDKLTYYINDDDLKPFDALE